MNALSPQETEAILLSMRVAGSALLFSLPLAILTAWVLAKYEFFGKSLVDALVHLPLVLPPVVVGYGLLQFFGRRGFTGDFLDTYFGFSLAFTWQGAAIASAVMAFPLIVRAIRLSMEDIDDGLLAVARTLGAGSVKRFLTVVLPLSLPGVIAGAVLGFARSLGEFGATIAFVSNIPGETQTIPLAVYSFMNIPGGEMEATRLVWASIFLSLVSLVLSEVLTRKARRSLGQT